MKAISDLTDKDVVSIPSQKEYNRIFDMFKDVAEPDYIEGYDGSFRHIVIGFCNPNKNSFTDGYLADSVGYTLHASTDF